MKNEPLFVTRPALPELQELIPYFKTIWDTRCLTNNGPIHQELETSIAAFLGVPYVSLFSNGTLALLTALQALRITGEVITTPFSFVATTHALWWNNIRPVFVDIDPNSYNLDPERVEAAITPRTTAILPVHVYGTPVDVEAMQTLAEKYGLKTIYDAAHAFGVRTGDRAVASYGDLSILSFHATKVFTTFEGGAIVMHDLATKRRIDYLKNFGFADETTVVAPGINAKMNELQAAIGVVQLRHTEEYLRKRENIGKFYERELGDIKGIRLLERANTVTHNWAYFPIFVDPDDFGVDRDRLYYALKERQIFGRRYFYPLISDFPTYRGLESAQPSNLPVAKKAADQVICLPIYPDLAIDDAARVVAIIKGLAR